MNSGSLLKQAYGNEENNVLMHVQNVERYAKEDSWQEARKELRKAKSAWDTISKRVQFSVERDEMIDISLSLSKLEGAIITEDSDLIFQELYTFYFSWESLG